MAAKTAIPPAPRARRFRGVSMIAATSVALAMSGVVLGAPAATADIGPCGATGVTGGSASAPTCTYSGVGSDTFTAPAGVTQISVTVVGAQGGSTVNFGSNGNNTTALGGAGGEAQGSINVTPGDVLQVDVAGVGGPGAPMGTGGFGGSNGGVAGGPGDGDGGAGGANPATSGTNQQTGQPASNAANLNDGGGGGGMSDVRFTSGGCAALACGLGSALLVGPGGGGAGGGVNPVTGGAGPGGGTGGAGGGASGANGSPGQGGNAGAFGGGATAAAGGTGGVSANNPTATGTSGANGQSGAGGAGGVGNGFEPGNSGTAGAGGGGGGGSFGGGGASGGGGTFGGKGGSGGGGGGGSGYLDPSVINGTLTAAVNSGAVNSGNGQVVVSWTAPVAAVPEVAWILALPLSAAVVLGSAVLWRRRRTAPVGFDKL